METYRIFISATASGSHGGDGKVNASYALRIVGKGVEKFFQSTSREAEVQAMYAKGLDDAFNYLWAEVSDAVAETKPAVDVIVRKPNMQVRFGDAENSLFEKTETGQTTATDNIETWLADAVWATHFHVSFREPDGDSERSALKDVERLAKAAFRDPAGTTGFSHG